MATCSSCGRVLYHKKFDVFVTFGVSWRTVLFSDDYGPEDQYLTFRDLEICPYCGVIISFSKHVIIPAEERPDNFLKNALAREKAFEDTSSWSRLKKLLGFSKPVPVETKLAADMTLEGIVNLNLYKALLVSETESTDERRKVLNGFIFYIDHTYQTSEQATMSAEDNKRLLLQRDAACQELADILSTMPGDRAFLLRIEMLRKIGKFDEALDLLGSIEALKQRESLYDIRERANELPVQKPSRIHSIPYDYQRDLYAVWAMQIKKCQKRDREPFDRHTYFSDDEDGILRFACIEECTVRARNR